MKEEDAKYHLDRCIKSGLWCPGGDDDTSEGNVLRFLRFRLYDS